MGFLTCIDHLKLSVREMFLKRFVDRGPVKTYNTYIYIYTYIKGAIRMAGKMCPNCGRLTFFQTLTGRKCTKCGYEMILAPNGGKGGRGTKCPNCGKMTVFNNRCQNCGATFKMGKWKIPSTMKYFSKLMGFYSLSIRDIRLFADWCSINLYNRDNNRKWRIPLKGQDEASCCRDKKQTEWDESSNLQES